MGAREPLQRLAALLRAAGRGDADRARVRGHGVGRRGAARLHRAPGRLVAQPSALRDRARPAGADRAAADVGRGQAQLELALPGAAGDRRDGHAALRARARAARRAARAASASAPRACRSTPSRPCGCCSTAACWCSAAALRPGRADRDARGARDAACPGRRPARRARRRRAAPAAGRGRARQDVHGRGAGDARRAARRGGRAGPRRRSRARRCCRSRPTRSRRSGASTASCRTWCGGWPTRCCPSTSGGAKHLAAAAMDEGEDELAEVVAGHYLAAARADPDADDADEIARRAVAALRQAGQRASSLAATLEAQRYYEQAADVRHRAARAGRPARARRHDGPHRRALGRGPRATSSGRWSCSRSRARPTPRPGSRRGWAR